MGHFSLEKTVKGVPRERLFTWFVDFSPDDVDIAKRRGAGILLSRQVSREGNTIHVENEILSRGVKQKYPFDATLHQDGFFYETRGGTPGLVDDRRKYAFVDAPGGGTTVQVEVDYRLLRGGLRFLDFFGLVRGQMRGMEDRLLGAFVGEAEDRLRT